MSTTASYLSLRAHLSCPDGLDARKPAKASFALELTAIPPSDVQHLAQSRPMDVAIAVDVSMSMYRSIGAVLAHLQRIVDRLPEGSTLTLWTFARDLVLFMNRASVRDSNREALKGQLRTICCRGGTNLELPLRALAAHTLAAPQHEGAPLSIGVILTDGQPMQGIKDPAALAALLPVDRVNHMLSYTSGADCWIAKAFGARSPKNSVRYCTTPEEVETTFEALFPLSKAFVVTGVEMRVEPAQDVFLVNDAADRGAVLPDVVDGKPVTRIVEFAVSNVPSAATQRIATVHVTSFDGEFEAHLDVALDRVDGTPDATSPVSGVLRAGLAKRKLDLGIEQVQTMLSTKRARDAAKLMRDLLSEVDHDEEQDGPVYRSIGVELHDLRKLCETLELSERPPPAPTPSPVRGHEEEEEADAGDAAPVYRSLGGGPRESSLDERDFMHRLVSIQNGLARA